MSSSSDPIAIIGSGPAGLITAYTLLQDGFTHVQILTRDSTPGGVWAAERLYPGLQINNVHGEYRFSALKMPPPVDKGPGGRLTGEDLCAYMKAFSAQFLQNIIRFDTEVINIRREEATSLWLITVENRKTGARETMEFSRVVLCTGGCSTPKVPAAFAPSAAANAGFRGPVIHSKNFASELDTILAAIPPASSKTIVIIGGGKSAQDMAAYLANKGRKVTIVFETADAFIASPIPLPAFIRKSRLLAIMAGSVSLRTRLERFLHNTWLGSKMTRLFWWALSRSSLLALSVPRSSPLQNTKSLFWSISVNDEGVPQSGRFHDLVHHGKIQVVSPARAVSLNEDSILLSNRRNIEADLVLLATGYSSSWADIFDRETAERVGLHRPTGKQNSHSTHGYYSHLSLANPPTAGSERAANMYNGIVPAKNISRRDLAVNGAVFTSNVGYTWEVVAHWISSYFLEDESLYANGLPRTPDEACRRTELHAEWIHQRYPGALESFNESCSSDIVFWTWPQYVDRLLEEMGVPSMRSGGNWLTWPFQVIDVDEINTLTEERRRKRDRK
ncbi:FAD/NAD-P-binding domain-containing protein [Roridomyces roridus]|uniref:FAD/NAD-P-binding domain-containing protein n=1 Tax=Roridomyces roridus TaxID=1738132 RepID=A0AAD7CAK8_9AGAR|nr:FAD/NAD-P-binding domain-containing protein [Roridomyces roridus]